MTTLISGRISASSQASRALSTASFTQVSRALRGLSNPRRCLFLLKNSATLMTRCFCASSSALVSDMTLSRAAIRYVKKVSHAQLPVLPLQPAEHPAVRASLEQALDGMARQRDILRQPDDAYCLPVDREIRLGQLLDDSAGLALLPDDPALDAYHALLRADVVAQEQNVQHVFGIQEKHRALGREAAADGLDKDLGGIQPHAVL